MTVTYPLSLPSSPDFTRTEWRKKEINSVTESPFTGEQQIQEYDGEWWEAELTLPAMTRKEARDWTGFLASLNGIRGTFHLGDPSATNPVGTAQGTPTVDSGTVDSTGTELDTTGWDANQSLLLARGDYLEVNNRLKKVTKDASSDANGDATIHVTPAFRTNPSDGDAITVFDPKGLFRLSSNEVSWTEEGIITSGLTLPVREVY